MSSGVTCVFYMKRFVELAGSYKMLTTMGFEKFVEAMGTITRDLHKRERVTNSVTRRLNYF